MSTHAMNIVRARYLIYLIWGASFVFLIFIFEFAPALRPGVISQTDAHSGLVKVFALFIPVMTTFAGFWFRIGEHPTTGTVSRQRWLPALATTIVYQIILLALFLWALFGVPYTKVEPALTFNDWVSNIMQIGLLLSPIATAPAAFLLGVEKLDVPDARA